MAIGTSDKSEFVAVVSVLLYMQHAGLAVTPMAPIATLADGPRAEQRATLADACITGAEALFERLQARGYVEQERA